MTAQAHTRSMEAQSDCKGGYVSPRPLIDIDIDIDVDVRRTQEQTYKGSSGRVVVATLLRRLY